jgi:hypothetical protein
MLYQPEKLIEYRDVVQDLMNLSEDDLRVVLGMYEAYYDL